MAEALLSITAEGRLPASLVCSQQGLNFGRCCRLRLFEFNLPKGDVTECVVVFY